VLNALIVKNLNVWYGDRHVLKDVNFSLPQNKILAIVGPSGSGKSTLLKVINRLIDLNPLARVSGSVRVLGMEVLSDGINLATLRRVVGMVFQTPNPFPHLSIYDNVALGPRYNRLVRNKEELDELVKESLIKAALWDEVKDRLHEKPVNLSGGQQQRLCIARALANKPRILLLDEPTSNIDPLSTQKIEHTLLELKKGITVVIVTHSLRQALRISDYLLFLENGRVVNYGSAEEISEVRSKAIGSYLKYSA